ncbi:hypothetical protein QBC46DRAFT_259770 [Diplogelasinospora grovesii]|uniref:NACHT domain-containing protein n=1 Tax=Diplogelasinospora grovesii TaxID=303347 RepID=A0AAN6N896_9PEZI|nr:hypothetical protein QBC46DRAFT_259770 [Diplogelasinospora grovesii]
MPLAPPASASARQTMKTAFDELNGIIMPRDSRDFHRTTLKDVREAALEIEVQLAARQSLCNMRRLMPLFNGLEHYAKIVDVLCNGTPFLPWVWAPISLILRISSEYVEAFEQIIKGYSRIASSLRRFEILGVAFAGNSDFQQTLAVFYADILQFHKHAYKFVRRGSWKLLFLASWGRFERRFDNILEDMQRHEDLIDREASALNIAEGRRMRQDIRTWREESLEKIGHLEEEQAEKQYQSIMSWLKVDESDQLAIFDSISTEGSKYPGTCGWIVKNPKVSAWLQRKPEPAMLWLQGSPGSGKSVMSTQLVNFMKTAKMFVIHHICTYSYVSSTTYEQILRSFLLQLLRTDRDLVAHVYSDCVLAKKSPSVSALEQLLQVLLSSVSSEPSQTEYIWIVLDGVDECETEKQARAVSLMNQIASKSSTSGGTICKVLISSRASSLLTKRLRKKQTVSLTDEKDLLGESMRQYASQRLQSLHRKLSQLDIGPDELHEIACGIARKADGMFLYARLVLDYLASNIFYSSDEIKTSINQLPEKLIDFYRKILTQILVPLDARSVGRVKCILGWIAFAKRPLKKLEFLSAITFSSGNPDVAQLAPQYILDICGSLVEERRDTTLAFIHVSVKDFLQQSSSNLVIHEREALQEHAMATITCLISGLDTFSEMDRGQSKYLRVVRGIHGLHVYATEYWTEYLLSEAKSETGLNPESPLFRLAVDLTSKLDEKIDPSAAQNSTSELNLPDARLALVQQHKVLYKHMERALRARSVKNLQQELLEKEGLDQQLTPTSALDGISAMLLVYQECVRSLVEQHDFPGVSAEELELFKSQFRTSAFTCRLNSCPRATLGFESKEPLLEHEMSHVRRLRCTFPGCQYPPFVSVRAFKNHVRTHESVPARRPIRRVGHIPKQTSSILSTPALNASENTIKDSMELRPAILDRLQHKSPYVGMPEDFMAYLFNSHDDNSC